MSDLASLSEVVEYNLNLWRMMGDNPDMMNGETEAQYLARLQAGWDYGPSKFMRDLEERMKRWRPKKQD